MKTRGFGLESDMASSWWCGAALKVVIAALLIPLVGTEEAKAAPPVARVGVVVDGQSEFYRELGEAFRKEVEALNAGQFEIVIDREKSVVCQFDAPCVAAAIKKLLRDPDLDLVVGHGFLASSELLTYKTLDKAAIAPFVIDPEAQGLPIDQGRKNLGFTLWSADLTANLRLVEDLVDYQTVTLVVDARVLEHWPSAIVDHLRAQAKTQKKELSLLSLDPSKDIESQIPKDVQLAYVGPLVSFPREQVQQLSQILAARKIPSFSWLGRTGVEAGYLAGSSSSYDVERLSRLVALNVQSLLNGQPAEAVMTNSGKRHLIINGQLMTALGLVPDTQPPCVREVAA